MPGACTADQIAREFALCESATADTAQCAAFNRDPANAVCRQCLYTTEDESTYGPIVYLKNRIRRINLSGCIALVGGAPSATDCATRLQTFETCADTACIDNCVSLDDFQRCTDAAQNGVCRIYAADTACIESPEYAACFEAATFEDSFRDVARIFCGAVVADGGRRDAAGG
jgi:hypothetical protein